MEQPEDDIVEETREKLDRAEQSDAADRAEALDEMHRSLETEIERPESEDPPS